MPSKKGLHTTEVLHVYKLLVWDEGEGVGTFEGAVKGRERNVADRESRRHRQSTLKKKTAGAPG